MTLSNSIFAVSGAATFLDARKDMSNLFACDTSLEPHPGLLTVGGDSAANGNVVVGMNNRMAVTVRPFQAVLNRLGALLIMNDGDVVVSLKAAPSANSRIDVVYVKQRETRAPISDSEDGPIIGVVTGTANLTPVAPQVPDGAVALAQVKVPSGVTNTTASGVVITQVYPFAATRGEELRFRSKEDMNGFAALDGTKAVTLSDNAHYVRDDGEWEPYNFIKSSAQARCATYVNNSGWYEFSVNTIVNMSGTASTDYSLGKEGSKGYLRVNRSGMYALNGFVNVEGLGQSGAVLNVVFRTTKSDNAWIPSLPTPVYVDSNSVTANAFTSLPVPTTFAYIDAGTRITLGFDNGYAKTVGGMTNFHIRRFG